jgi:Spy/CpxP family protein refolding chaperone
MKNIKLSVCTLAVIFLATGTLYAQQPGQMPKRGKEMKAQIAKELNLTPEQEKKLEENRKVQREQMANLLKALKEKQEKLQEALNNPAAKKTTVEPLASEIKSLQAQLFDARISGIFAVKEILTPEQFAKFQQMAEKSKEARAGHLRQKRMGGSWNKE